MSDATKEPSSTLNWVPAQKWIQLQVDFGRAPNTVDAYKRALEDYLSFCKHEAILPDAAKREDIARYVRDLSSRPNPHGIAIRTLDSGVGLANATMQQRLTVVRLFYDYLMEEGFRQDNPVGRGRYTPGKGFGGTRDRALIPRYQKLPWIPDDEQWRTVLEATREELLRNRVMFALAYDAGLRREELCTLFTSDIDPSHRLLHIRAEQTKNRRARTVPYSEATSVLYAAYLQHRRELSRERGPLFLSESRRNHAQPISIWTWSKVVERIAKRSGVSQFTTHTPRHLCLTDLARANWDLHEIATFAGHRSIQTTLLYIHLSGRELSAKLADGMAQIHAWRVSMLQEVLG
jgi:site-specific recombinase XerD